MLHDTSETLAQVAYRGGRCSIPGNIQCQARQGSNQPVLLEDVPAYCKEVGLDDHKSPFQPKPFCYMILYLSERFKKHCQELGAEFFFFFFLVHSCCCYWRTCWFSGSCRKIKVCPLSYIPYLLWYLETLVRQVNSWGAATEVKEQHFITIYSLCLDYIQRSARVTGKKISSSIKMTRSWISPQNAQDCPQLSMKYETRSFMLAVFVFL